MYLYGSLSSGDFNPETSDIDFLVVTTETSPPENNFRTRGHAQGNLGRQPESTGKLEGAYVHKELIRKHDPNGSPCPTVNEGKLRRRTRQRLGSFNVTSFVSMASYCKVQTRETLIDFVTPDDIRKAVMGTLNEWWFPMLENPGWLQNKTDGDRAFAVVTMCRVMHALEHGTIVSKPKAIQWAQAKLDDR